MAGRETARGLLRMRVQPCRCPCFSEPHGALRSAPASSTIPYPTLPHSTLVLGPLKPPASRRARQVRQAAGQVVVLSAGAYHTLLYPALVP